MSTLKVNNIIPQSGGSVTISGSSTFGGTQLASNSTNSALNTFNGEYFSQYVISGYTLNANPPNLTIKAYNPITKVTSSLGNATSSFIAGQPFYILRNIAYGGSVPSDGGAPWGLIYPPVIVSSSFNGTDTQVRITGSNNSSGFPTSGWTGNTVANPNSNNFTSSLEFNSGSLIIGGWLNSIRGNNNIVHGTYNSVTSSDYSIILGSVNNVRGDNSNIIYGDNNTIVGNAAFGGSTLHNNIIRGDFNIISGSNVVNNIINESFISGSAASFSAQSSFFNNLPSQYNFDTGQRGNHQGHYRSGSFQFYNSIINAITDQPLNNAAVMGGYFYPYVVSIRSILNGGYFFSTGSKGPQGFSEIRIANSITTGADLLMDQGGSSGGTIAAGTSNVIMAGNMLTSSAAHSSQIFGFQTHVIGGYTSAGPDATTLPPGGASMAQGYQTVTSGSAAHAEGYGTYARWDYQHVGGRFNLTGSTEHYGYYIIGNGTSNSVRSNAFRVSGSGDCFAGGTFTNGGADYAEYFESYDGLPISPGTVVELIGSYIKPCTVSENAIGVISSNPSILGNSDEGTGDEWIGKYQKDIWGNHIMVDEEYTEEILHFDSDGNPVLITDETHEYYGYQAMIEATKTRQIRALNPDYDPSMEYIPREQRPEWNVVGLLGQVKILVGQPVPSRWIKMKSLSNEVDLYFIK